MVHPVYIFLYILYNFFDNPKFDQKTILIQNVNILRSVFLEGRIRVVAHFVLLALVIATFCRFQVMFFVWLDFTNPFSTSVSLLVKEKRSMTRDFLKIQSSSTSTIRSPTDDEVDLGREVVMVPPVPLL